MSGCGSAPVLEDVVGITGIPIYPSTVPVLIISLYG